MRKSHRYFAHLLALLDRERLAKAAPPGTRLLVGVSGGADSVALLQALAKISKSQGISLAAAHIDHGLRPESGAEASFVAGVCEELQVPCFIRKLTDAANALGASPEAYWRKLRYREFAALVGEHGFDALALGHTADDLAETFLFHLVRGTGVRGLVFRFDSTVEVDMAPQEFPKGPPGPRQSLRIIRPLWKTSRGAVETALRELQHGWINDPSNDHLRYSRNLIRHHVLPVLREISPQASSAIVRASEAIESALRPSGNLDAFDLEPAVDEETNRISMMADPVGDSAAELPPRPEAEAVLQLGPLRSNGVHEWEIAEQVRRFASDHGCVLSSRQTAQATFMIRWKREGTVSLAGGKTLVLTRLFAWIFSETEPSPVVIAAEHARRFGGFFAEVSPVALTPVGEGTPAAGDVREYSAEVTALDGTRWEVRCKGLAEGCMVTNRQVGARVGNTALSKVISQSHLPWYLRDVLVFVMREDSNGAARAISVVGDHGELNALMARKNVQRPEIELVQVSGRA